MRKFTHTEKLACVEREIRQRRYVYPKRIAAGKMSPALAREHIADDYRELAAGERLL